MRWKQTDICFLIISSWLLEVIFFFHSKEPGREANVLSHFRRTNHVCTFTFRIKINAISTLMLVGKN